MKDVILLRLASQIRRMRVERGLSQADLAARAQVNRKTIIELEKGAPGTALGTVVAVLESMGGELTVVAASKPTTAEMRAMLGLEATQSSFQLKTLAQAPPLRRLRVTPRSHAKPGKPSGDHG